MIYPLARTGQLALRREVAGVNNERAIKRWRATVAKGRQNYANRLRTQSRVKIPAQSQRRRAERSTRAAILRELVHGKPCVAVWDAGCTYWAVDGHEIVSRARRPGAHLDRSLVRPVCRSCHDNITSNPEEAHRRGWAYHSWEQPE